MAPIGYREQLLKTKFEVTFTLSGFMLFDVEEATCKLIGLQLREDKDRFQTYATMAVEAIDGTKAVSEGKRRLEVFLGLFSVYSSKTMQISAGAQVDVKDMSTSQITVSATVYFYPVEKFNQERFREIHSDYFDMLLDEKNEFLRIALDYFRLGTIDTRSSNKIIDYFVALEALYGKDEEKTEMRYRFANRIATLLGEDPLSRKSLMQRARTLYDKRSTAVHGSPTELAPGDLSTLYEWVRDSILRFIVLAKKRQNHSEIVDEIDSAMLDNSIRDKMVQESGILIASKL